VTNSASNSKFRWEAWTNKFDPATSPFSDTSKHLNVRSQNILRLIDCMKWDALDILELPEHGKIFISSNSQHASIPEGSCSSRLARAYELSTGAHFSKRHAKRTSRTSEDSKILQDARICWYHSQASDRRCSDTIHKAQRLSNQASGSYSGSSFHPRLVSQWPSLR
jgi:hypothetical protein